MRIVSKFHDYYDSVMGHGQDKGVLFIRKTEKILDQDLLDTLEERVYDTWIGTSPRYRPKRRGKPEIKLILPYLPNSPVKVDHGEISELVFGAHHILFCGKVYRAVQVTSFYKFNKTLKLTPDPRIDFFYSFEELTEVIQSLGILVKDIYRQHSRFFNPEGVVSYLEKFLDKQGSNEFEELLIQRKIITAMRDYDDSVSFGDKVWQKDLPLGNVKFYKLKDSFSTFQELDMYISGVLGQQGKEVANISDKDRIHQRGFDEYSFRKLPEEKKRNR